MCYMASHIGCLVMIVGIPEADGWIGGFLQRLGRLSVWVW